MKSKPIGVRFDEQHLKFLQEKYPELDTPQKAVNFLLSQFWWRHHREDESSQFAFVEERRKNIPEATKQKVKETFDRIDAETTQSLTYQIPEGLPLPEDFTATPQGIAVPDEPLPYTEKEKAMVAEFNRSVDEEIAAIRKESVPAHLNTLWGKKNWKLEQQKRIEKLEASKL